MFIKYSLDPYILELHVYLINYSETPKVFNSFVFWQTLL